MTTSILNDALLLRNEPGERLQECLHNINLTLFDPIFHNSSSIQEAKQKVLYILCAFSEESPLLILRQDSKEEKEGICEYLGIPEFMRKKLMELSEPEVRRATTHYISQFAGPLFRSLMFMKIQSDDYELMITNRDFSIRKTEIVDDKEVVTETFDVKEHGKAIAEFARLSKTIDSLEKQIRQQVKRYEGIEDLQEFTRHGKDTGKLKGQRSGNVENTIK
jgi:hypothetical protein